MAARVGANVATSRKLATTSTNICPIVRPTSATTIGMPAATIEPKAMSRMMMATRRPIASLLGGSWPANSSTWPCAPTASWSPLSALTPSRMTFASAVETLSSPFSSVTKETVAYATVWSGLMAENEAARICCSSGVRVAMAAGSGPVDSGQSVPSGRALRIERVGHAGDRFQRRDLGEEGHDLLGHGRVHRRAGRGRPHDGRAAVEPAGVGTARREQVGGDLGLGVGQVEGVVQLTAHLGAEADDDHEGHEPGDEGDHRAANRPSGQAGHGAFFQREGRQRVLGIANAIVP